MSQNYFEQEVESSDISNIKTSVENSLWVKKLQELGCSEKVIAAIYYSCIKNNACLEYINPKIIDFKEFDNSAIMISKNIAPQLMIIDMINNEMYSTGNLYGDFRKENGGSYMRDLEVEGDEKIISCDTLYANRCYYANIEIEKKDKTVWINFYCRVGGAYASKYECGAG